MADRPSPQELEQAVRAANKHLYDAIGADYEKIDGRRSGRLEQWMADRLRLLARQSGKGALLDIGCGSGFVLRCAGGIFKRRFGIDISARILAAGYNEHDGAAAADVALLPFADESFDAVVCFAVLHHLYGVDALIREVLRLLKPGGVFYSDHDMDGGFYRRFQWPLKIYRSVFNAEHKYTGANRKISRQLYHLSEIHEDGIDSEEIIQNFKAAGFEVRPYYHWFGLNPVSDRIFGKTGRSPGNAPLFQLTAIKKPR